MAPNQHSFVMNYLIDSIRFFFIWRKTNLLTEKRWNFHKNISLALLSSHHRVLFYWFNETFNFSTMYRLIAKTENQLINSNSDEINNAWSILSSLRNCVFDLNHTSLPTFHFVIVFIKLNHRWVLNSEKKRHREKKQQHFPFERATEYYCWSYS